MLVKPASLASQGDLPKGSPKTFFFEFALNSGSYSFNKVFTKFSRQFGLAKHGSNLCQEFRANQPLKYKPGRVARSGWPSNNECTNIVPDRPCESKQVMGGFVSPETRVDFVGRI